MFCIELLNRSDDVQVRRTGRIIVDDADAVRNMIRDPHFLAIRSNRNADRIDAHGNAMCQFSRFGVDDIHRVGGGVDNKDAVTTDGNRVGMRTHKRWMADCVKFRGFRLACVRRIRVGANRNPGTRLPRRQEQQRGNYGDRGQCE